MNQSIRCILCALVLIAIPASPHAQAPALSAADAKELSYYRLTMDTVKKIEAATLTMAEEMKKDPRLQKLWEDEISRLAKRERAELKALVGAIRQHRDLARRLDLIYSVSGAVISVAFFT